MSKITEKIKCLFNILLGMGVDRNKGEKTQHRARKRKGTGKKAKLESTKDNRNKPNIFLTININGLTHQFKVKL